MRLWHYELLPYLPKSQLIAQWRELNSIFKNQPKHILINYVYNHNKDYLITYSHEVINEMKNRRYKIKDYNNMENYFHRKVFLVNKDLHYPEHNIRYLAQCYYNLEEKFDRGQKDFSSLMHKNLLQFMLSKFS